MAIPSVRDAFSNYNLKKMALNSTPEISQGCQDMSPQKRSILFQFFTTMPILEGLVGFLCLKVDNQAGVIAEAIPNLIFSKRNTISGPIFLSLGNLLFLTFYIVDNLSGW